MNTMKFVKGCLLAGILASSPLVMAEEEKAAGSGPNPYVDCGIGGSLFPTTGWAAVTSNVIWDAGTTALTSATMSPETCNAKSVETAQFILDNYNNLAEETAQGQGNHLTAMLNIMGCNTASHSSIISDIRSDMTSRINQQAYDKQDLIGKASGFYQTVTTAATNSCSA